MVSIKKDKIIIEALNLPVEKRAYLAEILLESLDHEKFELSNEWKDEIQKRCKEIDEGDIELISADQVFNEINNEL